MPIHFCLVAKDGVVAAEYAATAGNFAVIAQRLLEVLFAASREFDTFCAENTGRH
jgi:hypothetical protein